jgi:hypothetical protein
MSHIKSTKKGGKKGKAEGSKASRATTVQVSHAAVAWALATTLVIAPEGATSRKILAEANNLASAIGSTAFDMRPEYLLRATLDEYTRCDFRIDGHDREPARRAYNKLVRLAGGADDAPEPKDENSAGWRHWTMRRIRADFESGDPERYAAAWAYYDKLFKGLAADQNFFHVSFALRLLPQLIQAKQEIAGLI